MTAVSAFTGRIAYRVDGCPDPAIEQVVLDTCIEFCELSTAVRATLDAVPTVANQAEVELDVPTNTRVTRIMRVWVDGSELEALHEDQVGNPLIHAGTIAGLNNVVGCPRSFVESSSGVLRLWPVPDKVYTITARVALKPSRSATSVDDSLFEDHAEAIVDGALGRLLAMPEQWQDNKLAQYHLKRFVSAASDALTDSSIGSARAELRVQPVWI